MADNYKTIDNAKTLIPAWRFALSAGILVLLVISTNVSAYQPKPVDFWLNNEGEAFGILEDGTSFSQTNIVNNFTRLQKFCWNEGFWYISEKGVIEAENDLQALSIYLAK